MDGALKSPFQMELRDWLRPSLWALMLFVEIFDCIEMIWHFEFLQVLFIAWIFTITFFRSNKDSRKEPWVHSAPVTTHYPHLSYFAATEKETDAQWSAEYLPLNAISVPMVAKVNWKSL